MSKFLSEEPFRYSITNLALQKLKDVHSTVAILWKPLFEDGVHIDFAHRTFRWDSEASIKAHVHCVIIGFSVASSTKAKIIYTGDRPLVVDNINAYLIDAPSVFIESIKKQRNAKCQQII